MAKEVMIYIGNSNSINIKRLIMVLLDLGYSVRKDENYVWFELGGDDSIVPPENDPMFEELQKENLAKRKNKESGE